MLLKYEVRGKSGAQVRIHVSQVCLCVSTKPGMTMSPEASMTRMPSAGRSLPMAVMVFPWIRMSAFATSPSWGSWVRRVPPRIRVLSTIA